MNSSPLVTVFIPTFNRLKLLKRAVRSVTNCGCDVNLLVLDNCSTDGTFAWLEDERKKSRINFQVIRNENNIGASLNYLKAFQSIKSPYFVPLADDDELVPGFLSAALALAQKQENCIAIVGARAYKGFFKWNINWNKSRQTGFLTPENHIKDFLKFGHYVTWSSILWKTSIQQSKEVFRQSLEFGLLSDVFFQFEMFLTGPVYIIPIGAATFNTTDNQASTNVGTTLESFEDFIRLFEALNLRLKSISFYKDNELEELFSRFVLDCAKFIKYNRESALKADKDLELHETLKKYLNGFSPYIGLEEFPFTAELSAKDKGNIEWWGLIHSAKKRLINLRNRL